MSSFDFVVRNSAGQALAGSDFLGYSLVQEGSVVVVDQQLARINFSTTIKSKAPPIVAIQVRQYGGAWIRLCRVIGVEGNWTHCVLVGNRFSSSEPASVTYMYRVYAAEARSSESYGLRTVSDTNIVSFDSGFKQLVFTSFAYQWQGWPKVVDGNAPAGNNRVTWVGYRNPTLNVPPDGWLALSLANNSFTTTMESNATGKWQTYPMEVESTFVYESGRLIILFELYAATTAINYNIQFNTFCPIIEN